VVVGAALLLGGGADVAQFPDAPVAVVAGDTVGVGDAAAGLANSGVEIPEARQAATTTASSSAGMVLRRWRDTPSGLQARDLAFSGNGKLQAGQRLSETPDGRTSGSG